MLKIDRDILNNITVTINSKPVQLRKTVFQIEQYGAWVEARGKEEDKPNGPTEALKINAADSLTICRIALNPTPDKIDFTEDQIAAALDVAELDILAKVWMDYKMMRPRMGTDPFLGPAGGKTP